MMFLQKKSRWIWIALSVSLALHLVFALGTTSFLSSKYRSPIEWEMPENLEFGLMDATELVARVGAEEQSEPTPASPSKNEIASAASIAKTNGKDRPSKNKNKRMKPETDRAAQTEAKNKPEEVSVDESSAKGEEPSAFQKKLAIPKGSVFAVRINMGVVRSSPLAAEVSALLAAIPDWDALLAGSGIRPIEDLEKLLLASPNLSREKLVVAGQHAQKEGLIRDAVERMHQGKNQEPLWKSSDFGPQAAWPDSDQVERVVVNLGEKRFLISRPADVQRFLAATTVILKDKPRNNSELGAIVGPIADGSGEEGSPSANVAEATTNQDEVENPSAENEKAPPVRTRQLKQSLLEMKPGVGLKADVENLRMFAAKSPANLITKIPVRAKLQVSMKGLKYGVEIVGEYDSEKEASAAVPFVQAQLDALVRSAGLGAMFLRPLVRSLRLKAEGRLVVAAIELNQTQAQVALTYVTAQIPTLIKRRR